MSSEIEQHANVFLRLMIGNGRAEGECFGDGGVKIRYLEVEVHHRTLSTILRRPDGALVVRRLLEDDVNGTFGRRNDGRTGLLMDDGPAEELRVEGRQGTCVRRFDRRPPPHPILSRKHPWSLAPMPWRDSTIDVRATAVL